MSYGVIITHGRLLSFF